MPSRCGHSRQYIHQHTHNLKPGKLTTYATTSFSRTRCPPICSFLIAMQICLTSWQGRVPSRCIDHCRHTACSENSSTTFTLQKVFKEKGHSLLQRWYLIAARFVKTARRTWTRLRPSGVNRNLTWGNRRTASPGDGSTALNDYTTDRLVTPACRALTTSDIRSLTFRHRASCILGQAFHYSPENAFLYI